MNDAAAPRRIGRDLPSHIRDEPVTGTPAAMREAFARLAGPQPALGMVTPGGVACAVAGTGAPAAVWLHGGGYVYGGPESHAQTISFLARRLGAAVVMPRDWLAPEALRPAPMQDALSVLGAMSTPVALVGDSAGGHPALHLAFNRPEKIARLALIGANTDRTGLSLSRRANSARDPMNDDAQDTALARLASPTPPPTALARRRFLVRSTACCPRPSPARGTRFRPMTACAWRMPPPLRTWRSICASSAI